MNNNFGQQASYDFGRSLFRPFQSGQGSAGFVFKSAFFYSISLTILIFLFGKMLLGTFIDFMQFVADLENMSGDEAEMEMFIQMFAVMGKMILPISLITIGSWVVWAMVEAALFRRLFRDKDDGALPWRLGKDELRVMFCRLIVGLAGGAVFFVFYSVIMVAVIGAAVGGSQSGALGAIVGIIGFFGIFATFALFVFVIIRLSPASALSISENKFALSKTWPVTQGRFWPIIGSYAVVTVGGYILSYILQLITMLVFMGGFMALVPQFEDIEDLPPEEAMTQLIGLFTQPSILIGFAIMLVLYYAMQAIWFMHFAGIPAYAVELYNIDRSENSVEVFD